MSIEIAKLLKESHSRSNSYQNLLENSNLRKLGPANMQAILLQVEDFLDNNHIYSYKNWFEGLVNDGPYLEKYWVNIELKYEYDTMPDPQAIIRLVNLGVKVNFKEIEDKVDNKDVKFWIISLRIPKTLINVK